MDTGEKRALTAVEKKVWESEIMQDMLEGIKKGKGCRKEVLKSINLPRRGRFGPRPRKRKVIEGKAGVRVPQSKRKYLWG